MDKEILNEDIECLVEMKSAYNAELDKTVRKYMHIIGYSYVQTRNWVNAQVAALMINNKLEKKNNGEKEKRQTKEGL